MNARAGSTLVPEHPHSRNDFLFVDRAFVLYDAEHNHGHIFGVEFVRI
jgi:hypothetical protein